MYLIVYLYSIYGPFPVFKVLENGMRGCVRIDDGDILLGVYICIFIIYDI